MNFGVVATLLVKLLNEQNKVVLCIFSFLIFPNRQTK